MNMPVDRLHLLAALAYAMVGLGLGIYMAASHDHAQAVAHAHLLLVGFLLTFAYAVIGRLWLQGAAVILRRVQFVGHHLGVVGLITGLLLLYGSGPSRSALEPLLGASSILVMLALILMSVLVLKSGLFTKPNLETVRLD